MEREVYGAFEIIYSSQLKLILVLIRTKSLLNYHGKFYR